MTTTTGWYVQGYQSGTVNVLPDQPGEPYLTFYGPSGFSDDEGEDYTHRIRHAMADDVCAMLNGGPTPEWLTQMERQSETFLLASDGCQILACGPMVDLDPPNLNWASCSKPESAAKRARLIDGLVSGRRK